MDEATIPRHDPGARGERRARRNKHSDRLRIAIDLGSITLSLMSTGKINSRESLQMASRVFQAFNGSWNAVEEAAVQRADGVFVIRRSDLERREQKRS